jgi:hypothetical protein
MKRIKTNIIELDKLYKIPCKEWLERFENGKLDAHEAFKKYGEKYEWLYKNSNYDLIGWEIENNCFDWEKNSWAVAQFCKRKLDVNKYNWKDHYWAVRMFYPKLLKNKNSIRNKIKKNEVDDKLKEAVELLKNEISDESEHEFVFEKPLKIKIKEVLFKHEEKYLKVRSISIWPSEKLMILYLTNGDFIGILDDDAIDVLETKTIEL